MSAAISGLLGAIVGGLAAFGAAWLQLRSAAERQRQEVSRQENQRRQFLARRYLYQLEDAVDSLRYRVDNWVHRGGRGWSEGLHPGYWEITNLYAVGRALGAERILALEGIYIELDALFSTKHPKLHQGAVEKAVGKASGPAFFYYHRMALAEAVLDWTGNEFRILTYSEFLRRYQDPVWNLQSLLEPAREAFDSLDKKRLERLEEALITVCEHIKGLMDSLAIYGVGALEPRRSKLWSTQRDSSSQPSDP